MAKCEMVVGRTNALAVHRTEFRVAHKGQTQTGVRNVMHPAKVPAMKENRP